MKDYINKIYKDSKKDFFKKLSNWLENKNKKFIITANPETLMTALKNSKLNNILLNNNIIVADSIGILKGAKKININIKEKIPGIDITIELLRLANEFRYKVYFYGSSINTINNLKIVLNQYYPNINVVGINDGYYHDDDEIFKDIINKKPDIIIVALGIPKQELLIDKYINEFKHGIFIGVGGSLDVISKTKKRAPKIFIKLNLEWLYRIITEPSRIKRFYNNNIKFLFKLK